MNVIFLIETQFNVRDNERFGVEELIQRGFNVSIWDLTRVLHKNILKQIMPPDPMDCEYVHIFGSKHEIISAINRLYSKSFIINLIKLRVDTLSILRAISRKKIPYSLNRYYSNILSIMPLGTVPPTLYKRLMYSLSLVNLGNKALQYSFIVRKLNIRPASHIFAGGAKSDLKGVLIAAHTKIHFIHSLDYDQYLKHNLRPSNNGGIVFLDQYIHFHPDNARNNEKIDDYSQYYTELCRFFSVIEKKTGEDVIIAAHPRSHYENHIDLFGGRKVLKGETLTLVSQAKLVLCHYSLSINYAVLYEKPILFLTTKNFNETVYNLYITELATYFNKSVTNITSANADEIDIVDMFNIDQNSYKNFKNDFIKSNNSPNKYSWEIVGDVIEENGHYSILGLVGLQDEVHNRFLDYEVIGDDRDLPKLAKKYDYALITLGQIRTAEHRLRLYQNASQLGFQFPVIIAPSAQVSRYATLGAGTIVMHGAIVNAGVRVGANCIINTHALLEHDTMVGDHCHISTGTILNGNVTVGSSCFIGSGSVIKESLAIGKGSVVGMGITVRYNLNNNSYYVGHEKV